MEGWIKIHRKIIESSWFNKSEYVHLWLYLLLMANHKEKEIFIGNKKILIKRGQFLTSRKKLSEAVHIQENKIYRILKCFENEHQIEQLKTHQYTVISILNYDDYQKSEQANEQQMNSKCTTDEQQMNTNKNEKNDKNIYLMLFKKYKERIRTIKYWSEKIVLINQLRNEELYLGLSNEQQDSIVEELMCL